MANGKSATVTARSARNPDAGPSDGELLGRFNTRVDGSAEAAFEALVRRHGPMVLRVCGQILDDRHGAEDAFQATFLILARKSGSIRRPESLGSWLYGVAIRTAREAKMRDGRRRRLESTAAEGAAPALTPDATRPELALITLEEFEALHEEVARLPERYRVPVVLCELEGLTYEEVARRMSCPVSTVGVRLVRARERLRSRLIRRGIAPVAALMEALFGEGGASAIMSASLIESTVRGASLFAVGDYVAMGGVPASTVALSHAVLAAMTLARVKLATSSALIVALVGLGWVGLNRPSSAPIPEVGAVLIAPAPVSIVNATVAPVDGGAAPEPDRPTVPEVVEAPKPVMPATREIVRRAVEERSRGELLFFKTWVRNDPASPRGDGLGPVFNESSCVACHGLGAPGGAGPENKNVVMLTASLNSGSRPPKGLDQVHAGFKGGRSTVLHRYGTDPQYASWRRQLLGATDKKAQAQAGQAEPVREKKETVEARINRIAAEAQPQARSAGRPPILRPTDGIRLTVTERNTPALFGAGRIDSISSEAIVEEAKGQPAEVRGRVSRDRVGRVGRFGWKAQVSRLHEFVRVACAGELGLEVPGHSQSISPLAPTDRPKGLDLTESQCDELVSFVRSLPSPVAIDPDGPQGGHGMVEGRRLFAEVGCASCHAPSLGEVRGIYSDLLLHEMGPTLSDSGEYYGFEDPNAKVASPGEWRTPPLWGYRDSGPYLHDGRAETLEEVVALHGGQGFRSSRQFFALSVEQRVFIETFLKSLVAPSSATNPGVVLASDLEERFMPQEARQAEALVRAQRLEAEARDMERHRQELRKKTAAEIARRAPTRLQMASELEKVGNTTSALEYYLQVAVDAPGTKEAESALVRIAALQAARPKTP